MGCVNSLGELGSCSTSIKANRYRHLNSFVVRRYTGHCPTLKFHYGRCYGTKTKEILKVGQLKKKVFFTCPVSDILCTGRIRITLNGRLQITHSDVTAQRNSASYETKKDDDI
jgi:hypothetical protein